MIMRLDWPITPTTTTTSRSPVAWSMYRVRNMAVLTHEFGHVLGFAHYG